MKQGRIKSPAKVNLYLHITGKDKFNYHLLDTLVCFLPDLYDTIDIKETNSNKHIIETQGQWMKDVGVNNILEIALNKIDHLLHKQKFNIILEKNIPVGAGLGGGSSNAACVLNYIIDQYQLPISYTEKLKIYSEIGADVYMFNCQNALYAMGIGNVICPTVSFPEELFVLLVYPKHSLSTKDIYQNYTHDFTRSVRHDYCLDIKTLLKLLTQTKNDLYKSSLDFFPELGNIIAEINSLKSCLFTRMSGSGSSCFGLFQDQNALILAELELQEKWPNFFITKSRVQ